MNRPLSLTTNARRLARIWRAGRVAVGGDVAFKWFAPMLTIRAAR